MDAKPIALIGVVLEVIPLWVMWRGKPFIGKSRSRSSSYRRSQAAGAFLIVVTLPSCLLAASLTDQGAIAVYVLAALCLVAGSAISFARGRHRHDYE